MSKSYFDPLSEIIELRQKLQTAERAHKATIIAYQSLLDALHSFRHSISLIHQLKSLKDLPSCIEDIACLRSLPQMRVILDQELFSGYVPQEISLVSANQLQQHLTQFSPTIHAPRLYLGLVAHINHPDFFLGGHKKSAQGSCFIFCLNHKYQRQKTIGILVGYDPDPTRFTAHKASDFLEHFCEILSATLVTLLEHAQLKELSILDDLTKVHNRSYLQRHAQRILDFSARKNLPVHLLFIDLNHFKAINDTLGHETGDLVLIAVAQTIQNMIRKYDIFVRLGGDEFIIVLPDTDAQRAQAFISRLDQALSLINVADLCGVPTSLKISASVGLAAFARGLTLEDLIRSADQNMYLKKRKEHTPPGQEPNSPLAPKAHAS